jgi:predicted TIM-barrel fold metal-dependent hydrolase
MVPPGRHGGWEGRRRGGGRTVIVDSHAHIFPPLSGASGYAGVAEHRLYIQKILVGHVQPYRSAGTGEIIDDEGMLWDPRRPGVGGYRDVGLDVSAYGRFSWTKDGASYFLQYMPPWLKEQEMSAEFLGALMDHAGVGAAVLQNDHVYGDLNRYFADAVAAFPGRFIGLIQVDETQADHDEQIARLHEGTSAGLRGLFYKPAAFFRVDFRDSFEAPRFAGFWAEVERLRLPVYWDLVPLPGNEKADYLDQLGRFAAWCERYPTIPCLLVQALPTRLFFVNGRLELPPLFERLVAERGLLLELTLPIVWARWYDYPYAETAPIVKRLYDAFGAHRLVWGSDAPNIERYCTYRQAWTYLGRACAFLRGAELEAILGGNLRRFFRGAIPDS